MNYNLPTFQTAGYVSPLGLLSGEGVHVQLTRGWAILADVAETSRRRNAYEDHFRTGLHGLMHNRSHQAEY